MMSEAAREGVTLGGTAPPGCGGAMGPGAHSPVDATLAV
jgi:hypothetical protein